MRRGNDTPQLEIKAFAEALNDLGVFVCPAAIASLRSDRQKSTLLRSSVTSLIEAGHRLLQSNPAALEALEGLRPLIRGGAWTPARTRSTRRLAVEFAESLGLFQRAAGCCPIHGEICPRVARRA
jgi:hypothetical protein